jgi:hypothetical protein
MSNQYSILDDFTNPLLVELSEAEQEASNGGQMVAPPAPTAPTTPMPPMPSIPSNLFGTPSASCPACSSGMNPNYGSGPVFIPPTVMSTST